MCQAKCKFTFNRNYRRRVLLFGLWAFIEVKNFFKNKTIKLELRLLFVSVIPE